MNHYQVVCARVTVAYVMFCRICGADIPGDVQILLKIRVFNLLSDILAIMQNFY